MTNPFSPRYYRQEKDALNVQQMENNSVKVGVHDYKMKVLQGFMYTTPDVELKKVPVLTINGETWMSLTPLEIESHYMPIQLAKGKVGVAGLGLGYYTQRILDKEEVSEVIVYELNQEVIDTYLMLFGEHTKLTIKKENALHIKNEEFDFFYNDIYATVLHEDVVVDMLKITKNNKINLYHFWSQEQLVRELSRNNYPVPKEWVERYAEFFNYYKRAMNGVRRPMNLASEASAHYYKQLKNTLYKEVKLEDWKVRI